MLGLLLRIGRFIATNTWLVGGLTVLLLAVSVLTVPSARQNWFSLWAKITRAPISSGVEIGGGQSSPTGAVLPAEGRACLTCHVDMVAKLGAAKVHLPFAEERCLTCHTGHDSKKFTTSLVKVKDGDMSKLCGGCHDQSNQKKMTNKHKPWEAAWCTACHDPHASDNDYELKVPPSQLCLNCHNMNLRYGAKKVQHPPFKAKACLGCHVPHASDNVKNTRLPLPYLCMNCHPIVMRDMSLAVLHPPFSQAWCTQCHSPHATNWPRMAKAPDDSKQPFVDLCLQCHGGKMGRVSQIQLSISHPVGKRPNGQDFIDPLTGTQLACISCHHPHSSNNPRMWRRDRDYLCLGCHRKLPAPFNMPW